MQLFRRISIYSYSHSNSKVGERGCACGHGSYWKTKGKIFKRRVLSTASHGHVSAEPDRVEFLGNPHV